MGRTIPSFRIASVIEEQEWKSFRSSLDKSDRKIFHNYIQLATLSREIKKIEQRQAGA
jgi:hypothetical protein